MREVQITRWCDNHSEEKIQATVSRTVSVDDSPPVELDLCDDCDTGPFTAFLQLVGRGAVLPDRRGRVAGAKRGPKLVAVDNKCPEPDCDYQPKNAVNQRHGRRVLGQHILRAHGKGFRDYREVQRKGDLSDD